MIWREGEANTVSEIITPNTRVRIQGKWYEHPQSRQRISLNSYQYRDAKMLHKMVMRNRKHFEKFDGQWTVNYNSIAKVNGKIDDPDNTHRYRFTIKDAGENLVGGINLDRHLTVDTIATVGYFIDQMSLGLGFASHALILMMAFGLDALGITEFRAEIHRDNIPSIRTAERAGMTYWDKIPSSEYDLYHVVYSA